MWFRKGNRENLSSARNKIAEELKIIDESKFAFCWIVDYPMFELDEKNKKVVFSHNPFQCLKEI